MPKFHEPVAFFNNAQTQFYGNSLSTSQKIYRLSLRTKTKKTLFWFGVLYNNIT